ncbi:MAG: hypothetical protein JSU85_16055, partial [Candidatus Zixiibacteriota bacterium]
VGALILRGIISYPGYENEEIIYYGPQQTNIEFVSDAPKSFISCRNYPNPFNVNTVIHVTGIAVFDSRLIIYDILGRRIAKLSPYLRQEGGLLFRWDGLDDEGIECSSGRYFYLVADSFRKTGGSMLYLK